MIGLITLHHTGTGLLKFKLDEAGLDWQHFHTSTAKRRVGWDQVVKQYRDMPVVVPIRHPIRVANSWIKRDRSLDKYWKPDWDLLFWVIYQLDPILVPIDADPGIRDMHMSVLGDEVGVEFSDNWPIVNTVANTAETRLEDIEPAPEALELLREKSEFFSRFYDLDGVTQ